MSILWQFSIFFLAVLLAGFPFPGNKLSARESEITFVLQIVPVRIAVVEEQNEILELWKYVKAGETYYELQIRFGTFTGQLLSTSVSISQDYENLIPFVNLEKQGLAYDVASGVTEKYNYVMFLRNE